MKVNIWYHIDTYAYSEDRCVAFLESDGGLSKDSLRATGKTFEEAREHVVEMFQELPADEIGVEIEK